jgi:hypothetical protein
MAGLSRGLHSGRLACRSTVSLLQTWGWATLTSGPCVDFDRVAPARNGPPGFYGSARPIPIPLLLPIGGATGFRLRQTWGDLRPSRLAAAPSVFCRFRRQSVARDVIPVGTGDANLLASVPSMVMPVWRGIDEPNACGKLRDRSRHCRHCGLIARALSAAEAVRGCSGRG